MPKPPEDRNTHTEDHPKTEEARTVEKEKERARSADKDESKTDAFRDDVLDDDEDRQSFFEKTLGMGWSLGGLVKKTIKGSLNSLFMSEDGLAQSLTELALPKELTSMIMQYAEGSKKEFTRLLTKEIKSFLESANFYHELRRFLSTVEIDFQAKIKFNPREDLPHPSDITEKTSTDETETPAPEPKTSDISAQIRKKDPKK